MTDYSLTNSAAEIDQAIQDSVDLVTPLKTASPTSITAYGDNGNGVSVEDAATAIKNAHDLLPGSVGETIYNTGNTGTLKIGRIPDGSQQSVIIADGVGILDIERTAITSQDMAKFWNPNGNVGKIQTSGTSTLYVTTSDNRLKTDLGKPTDEQINSKFNDIFETFTLFEWKNGGNSEPVWGFFAHDAIDKGLDIASEGDGSRELEIGEVYETIPAELDVDGNEIKPAIEKIVTPAGVDQSKVVPYLVAKIEQLERRLKTLENN